MATYKDIQDWVKRNYGKVPKTCWIAHCKEMYNLEIRVRAPSRSDFIRKNPCPEPMRGPICEAFRHFGML